MGHIKEIYCLFLTRFNLFNYLHSFIWYNTLKLKMQIRNINKSLSVTDFLPFKCYKTPLKRKERL